MMSAKMKSARIQEAHKLGQTAEDAAAVDGLIGDNAEFYEAVLLGGIEGFTAGFNGQCRSGLAEFVRNAFSVLETYKIWLPQNTAKFNIANVGLTEASNVCYAFCDIT